MTDYYVRATGGNDGGDGHDGTTFALGWATLQYAFDTVAAGDTLYICSTTVAPFTIAASVDIDTAAPAVATPIYVRGADLTTGAAYAGTGQAKITTTTNGLTSGLLSFGAPDCYHFYDLLFNGGGSGKASYGVYSAFTTGYGDYCSFTRCRFTNCSAAGCYVRGVSNTFTLCEFDLNGAGGASYGLYIRGSGNRVLGCSFHDNTGVGCGIYSGVSYAIIQNCVSYGNSADGIVFAGSSTHAMLAGCTAASNGGDGIDITITSGFVSLINCTSAFNGGYGYNFNAADVDIVAPYIFNCHTGTGAGTGVNTSGVTDINGAVLPGLGNITGSPLFVSTTDGSENFNLQSTSPLKAAGIPGALPAGGTGYMDIGALQRAEPTVPSEDDVTDGTGYGDGGTQYTGNFTSPSEEFVIDGQTYGVGGVGNTGEYVEVDHADVEFGVAYGPGSIYTGTFVVPLPADVEDGVFYGDANEFEGEFVGGGSVIVIED